MQHLDSDDLCALKESLEDALTALLRAWVALGVSQPPRPPYEALDAALRADEKYTEARLQLRVAMSQVETALGRSGWPELMELEARVNEAIDLACQVAFGVGWTAKG